MWAYLLEIHYPISERETIEALFPHSSSHEVVLSIHRYGEDLLALVASRSSLHQYRQSCSLHPAVLSCHHKRRGISRVTFQEATDDACKTFPLRAAEEWYHGEGTVKYLCLPTLPLSESQVAWLNQTERVVSWEETFDLSSGAWPRFQEGAEAE
jgi:hypothetical protein